jgi:HNH endonuclease
VATWSRTCAPSVNPKRPKFLPLPPQARLLELFTYDPLTGAWDNCITRGQGRQARAGEPAGSWKLDKKKLLRRRVWVDHKLYYPSRLIWKYVHGVDPQGQVDHIDRDTTNEKLDNLRDITNGQQMLNKSRPRNNTTGTKGVYFRPGTKRRRARWTACYHGKQFGMCKTKLGAIITSATAAIEHEGVEAARKNSA